MGIQAKMTDCQKTQYTFLGGGGNFGSQSYLHTHACPHGILVKVEDQGGGKGLVTERPDVEAQIKLLLDFQKMALQSIFTALRPSGQTLIRKHTGQTYNIGILV